MHIRKYVTMFDRKTFSRLTLIKLTKIVFKQQDMPKYIKFAGTRIVIMEELPTFLLCRVCLATLLTIAKI